MNLVIDRLLKTFEQPLFRGLSLSVASGEVCAVIGPNGCGKTTLLNIVAGSVPSDGGEIFADAHRIDVLPAHRRAAFVSYVRQGRHEAMPRTLRAADVLALASHPEAGPFRFVHNFSHTKQRFDAELGSLGSKLQQRCDTLSGGEQQRLSLVSSAAAMTARRGNGWIWLLDEHIAHLDPPATTEIMQLTVKIAHEFEAATVVVTHNMSVASQYCDRIVLLRDGHFALEFRRDYMAWPSAATLLELVTK